MIQPDWDKSGRAFSTFLLTTGKSIETERTYVAAARLFVSWVAQHEACVETAGRELIELFLGEQLRCLAQSTARNRLYAVRCYYDFLISRGIRQDNPTAGMSVKKPKTLPKQPVSALDMRKLFYGCRSERDQAIVLFFYSTGVRLSELASMRIENILWDQRLIIINGKGNKQRLVDPGDTAMDALRAVVGNRKRGAVWLTPKGVPLNAQRIRQNFHRLACRMNVRAHPHKLRATFANNFLSEGGDIGALRATMGHADITTTAHYAQATETDRGLALMARMDFAGRIL